MTFIWPVMLVSLLVLPLLMALYVALGRRRQRRLANFGRTGLAPAGKAKLGARRHLPTIFFFIGMALMLFSLARPEAVLSLPRQQGTVVLAFDVSGSMAAKDMQPTRMEAAKAAARAFVEKQPATVQVGVVSFSESGFQAQVPTNDKDAIFMAINRLAPTRGTSLANGILAGLDAIEKSLQGEQTNFYSNATPEATPEPTPMPAGRFASAAMVLLTDGENTVRPDPMIAVEEAMKRGVRIYTIGVGSPEGETLNIEGFSVHTQLDEPALQAIAQATSGEYFNARSEEDLRKIYDALGSQFVVKAEETEITFAFAGLGLLSLLIGAALSLWWFGRVP